MSTGTALAVIENEKFLALSGGEAVDIAGAIAETFGDDSGFSIKESLLTRVTIPAQGGIVWTIEDKSSGEVAVQQTLVGVPIFFESRGILWPNEEPAEGTIPAIVSHGCQRGRVVSVDSLREYLASVSEECAEATLACIGTYCEDLAEVSVGDEVEYAKLPANQFGSGYNGRSKRVTESRVVYLLREQDAMPIVVSLSAASCKAWDVFVGQLLLRGLRHWGVVVELGLSRDQNADGITYSKVVPKLVGKLSADAQKSLGDGLRPACKLISGAAFAS